MPEGGLESVDVRAIRGRGDLQIACAAQVESLHGGEIRRDFERNAIPLVDESSRDEIESLL